MLDAYWELRNRSAVRFTTGSTWALWMGIAVLMAACALHVSAQTLHYAKPPNAKNGRLIYNSGCIACHGATGDGAPQTSTEFVRPDTWPYFSKCDQTTPESNAEWKDVILYGGKARGFSEIMPAFGELMIGSEVNDVIAYMRTLCHNTGHYPLGELNLPDALVTEKAFPENEEVLLTAANATGAPSYTTDVIHEETFAGRNQIEVDVPMNYADQNHNWTAGVGDISLGLKREIFSSLRTGSILSLQGGVILPTGDKKRGFGSGTTQLEPFAAFDQLFKENTFLEFQLGSDLPVDTSVAPRTIFWRSLVGQALIADDGLGRQFIPMVEVLGSRDFKQGENNDWDLLPELFVTLSPRQHIQADVGFRQPVANTRGRTPQVVFFVRWDWADGKLWEGW